jgi:protein-tyrosine kinase
MAERIQSALAKARARRQERGGGTGTEVGMPVQSSPVANAWAGLPEIHLSAAQLARGRIFTAAGGEAAAPFDMLRTRMMRELRARGWRRVAITAPRTATGSSTVAANLAFSLARQSDLRSVLIETDLRHPSLVSMLGLDARPQFSELLDGTAAPPEHLLRVGETLCLALNSAPVQGAAELLQNRNVPPLLEEIERLLDPSVMIFDLPPMLENDDTLAFLDKVDCALLVVAADSTRMPEIDACVEDLSRHTNALGVVLNKLRTGAEAENAESR